MALKWVHLCKESKIVSTTGNVLNLAIITYSLIGDSSDNMLLQN